MAPSRISRLVNFSVVVCLLVVTSMQYAHAQWTYRVASDPYIRNISVFAGVPAAGSNTLIVSTLTDGMYKIVDTGNQQTSTFQKINNGIPIPEIRFHTTIDINTIYAGTDGAGLFRTTDGGANWLPLNGSGAGALGCLNIRQWNSDTTPTPRLLVGTSCRNNSGFYQSLDNGLTWTRIGAGLPDDVAVSGLTRDTTSGTYFLATSNYGVFKSVDSGANWAAANSGITTANGILNVFNIQFNGAAPTNLLTYVHGGGVYRSLDAGANWTLSETGLPPGYAALGGIQKESNAILYIGLDRQGMYKSTNNGLNWAPWGNTATGNNTQVARSLAFFPSVAPTTYYIGTIDGLAKTTDAAATTNSVVEFNGGGRINAITHDRDTPYTAYVTAASLYKLDYIYGNCNAGCAPMDTGITGNTIEGVAYQDKSNPATFYVTTSNRGIFKSTNGGALFSAINNGLPNMIGQTSRLAIDESNPQTLYLGLSNAAGVFKSTNGGALWTASNNGLDTPEKRSIVTVTQDQNNTNIVYAATNAGLYKSIDSGANWILKYSATDSGGSLLPISGIRVRTGNSNEIYIANNHVNANGSLAASSGIHKSIDGGTSWTNILANQKASQVRVLTNGDVYAGISANSGNPGVWLSTGGGAMTPYSGGLNGSDIRTFGVAADRSAVISLSLENGLYTHNVTGPPPSVAVSATITEAPFVMTTLYFDPQPVNTTSAAKSVTVTNTSASAATIVAFGVDNDQFTAQSHTCGTSLAPGATCMVNVVFNPFNTGDTSGTLFAAGPVSGISIPVGGIGTSAQPAGMYSMVPGMVPAYPGLANTANIRELSWGNQAVGTSRTLSVVLKSIGSVPLNITSITIDQPQFTLSGTCTGGVQSVPAGGSCTMSVTYTPTAPGNNTANLTVNSNTTLGPAGRINLALMGVGETAATDGSLIPAFGDGGRNYISTGPYGNEYAESIAKQSDGKTLVLSVGRNAVENGYSIPVITRLDQNGALDTTWGTAGYVRLPTPGGGGASGTNSGNLFVLPSGKLIVLIDYNTPSNGNDTIVYRLLSTGAIDTTFGTAGTVTIASLFGTHIRLYADDRMLLGGVDATTSPTNNQLSFVRLTADGAFDPTFGTSGRSNILLPETAESGNGTTQFEIGSDGKILFAYAFGTGTARDFAIYRLTTAGVIDTTWGTNGRLTVAPTAREDNIRQMRTQIDGKLLIAARTSQPTSATNYEISLIRLNTDGSLDTGFGVNGVVETIIGAAGTVNVRARDMLVMPDGKIVVAGHRNGAGFGNDLFIARYLANGLLDASFGNNGIKDLPLSRQSELAGSIAIDNDGGLLLAGSLTLTDSDRGNIIGTGVVLKVKNVVGAALLNLTVSVSGSGTVTSSPLGINCGNVCVASFAPATMVTLTAATSGGSVFAGWSGGGCSGTGTCTVTLTMATSVTATFTGGVAMLVAVQSRKVHAGVTYDLPITVGVLINGAITVEPRLIGAGHKIVFQFDQTIAAMLPGSATSTVGTANASASGNQEVIVTLTGVPDNQRATISLSNVNGNGTNANVSMGFLVGDVSSSQRVNASDISAVKARATGGILTPQNFKFDLSVSGAINAQDTTLVKARSGLSIP